MQQAYRVLRVVAEAQTIRVVLTPDPNELMLSELRTVCAGLSSESGNGIKAVALDFTADAIEHREDKVTSFPGIEETIVALRGAPQPILAVVRATPSTVASALIRVADMTLVANDASLIVPIAGSSSDTLPGLQAARLGYITWSAPAGEIDKEMECILDLLREKSAVALRYAKASVRLAQGGHATRLETLKQVNTFYLTQVMQSIDASEGLHAFLEKREPRWKNM